jgi:hypothetical protein
MAYMAAVMWALTPQSRRQLIKMRAARIVQQATGASARRAGEASMRTELDTGVRLYWAPYLLSRLRDAAGAAYDRARSA